MKKGSYMVPAVIVTLIMVLISLVLLLYFAGRLEGAVTECNGAVEGCRLSIARSELSETFGLDIVKNCPASDPYFFKKESPDEVNKAIAVEIEKCILKFGKGQTDFSSAKLGSILTRQYSEQMVCFKCAEFDFKDYIQKEKYSQAGNRLDIFLRKNNIACSSPKVSFEQFFNDIETKSSFMRVRQSDLDLEGNNILMAMINLRGWKERVKLKLIALPTIVYLTPIKSQEIAACDLLLG